VPGGELERHTMLCSPGPAQNGHCLQGALDQRRGVDPDLTRDGSVMSIAPVIDCVA
jgi:hypothetical protein